MPGRLPRPPCGNAVLHDVGGIGFEEHHSALGAGRELSFGGEDNGHNAALAENLVAAIDHMGMEEQQLQLLNILR